MPLPEGYHLDWTGEYESQQRANRRLAVIVPITVLLMSFILYSAFDSWKWVALILAVVALSPFGGLLSLLLTGTHFSVSSGLGFLALIGVSVEIGVIMVEYINQLRTRGMNPREAAKEGALLRLRPIMMTMLVATTGSPACCLVPRYRFRLTTSFRHRDCGWADRGTYCQHRAAADVVCVLGPSRRYSPAAGDWIYRRRRAC